MKKIFLLTIFCLLLGCGSDFEPKLTGWTANTDIFKPIIYLNIDGHSKKLELPGYGYHDAQWTKNQNLLLLTQTLEINKCYEYQIISMDTSGAVVDTIFTALPSKALEFKLAPNDSNLLLKTFNWDCANRSNNFNFDYRYTFYNRFSKKGLLDTIKVRNAINIGFNETVWSPDSKKVIIEEWTGNNRTRAAFIFDISTKDTTHIDTGTDFIWSPFDNDLVAYIKDYSVYTKNIRTGETEIIYKGRKKKKVTDFRWNPTGDFLMINITGYFLNIESKALWKPTRIYISMPDKKESEELYNNARIDTWR